MNTMQFLGIYPHTIEDAAEKAEAAMEDAGVNLSDIDYMYDSVRERFEGGELDYSDITNSFVSEFYDYAKNAIEEEIDGIEITYYVNGDDSHFYVNGEEYCKGDDTITDLRNNISISFLELVEYQNIPALKLTLDIADDEVLIDLLNGAEDKDGNSLSDIYDKDGTDLLDEIDQAERFVNFEAAALLLENGKRIFEISVFDTEQEKEFVMRADRPKQLELTDKLSAKTDMAIRSWQGEHYTIYTEEEQFLDKHLKNRKNQKENGRECDM